MRRFARALSVVLGLAVIGSVVSLVPQKSATATGSAPVTVTNTSLPVTGNVTVSGTVGVNNFPATQNVNITNPAIPVSGNLGVTGNVPVVNPLDASANSIPLVTRDADNGARHPFLSTNTCTLDSLVGCFAVNHDIPVGQTLVLEDVSGQCTAGQFSPSEVTVQVVQADGSINGTLFFTPVALPSSGSPTAFGFGRTVKAYVPHPATLQSPLLFVVHDASQGSCTVTYSGYLITA